MSPPNDVSPMAGSVSAPAQARPVVLGELVGGAVTAPAWQSAFGFPCLRVPRVVDGIVEPPAFAVLRSAEALGGIADQAWQPDRGGAFGHVLRSHTVLQLATARQTDAYVQVYAFGSPFARDAYTITRARGVR